MTLLWIICGLLIAVSVIVWLRIRSRRSANPKVVSIHSYKKPAAGEQKCSNCKHKVKKLTFYADHNGSIVGLCKECKPLAERKDLMPL